MSDFVATHNTLAAVHGYARIPTQDHAGACRAAFARVRREVWDAREARLMAKWESYG